MKFRVEREVLADAVTWVARGLPARPPVPVLAGVLIEADEESVKYYVDAYGDENIVFSTDYPHADSKYPRSIEAFRKLPLSPASQKRILWDNCRRLYGLA